MASEQPRIHLECQDCEEVDFEVGLAAAGVSSDGVRDVTDEKLEEVVGSTECVACGGEVRVEEVDPDE